MRYRSDRLAGAISRALPYASGEDAAVLQASKDAGSASLCGVQVAARLLRASVGTEGHWIHELLHGAEPLVPPRAAKPPTHPELGPRLKRLRAAQEDREYAQMVGAVLADDHTNGRDAAEMNTFRSQIGVCSPPQLHGIMPQSALTAVLAHSTIL